MIRVQEGRPIGELWGKKFAGISSNGEWLFFNANGDVIQSTDASEADDQVIGNGMPDFQLGFDNTITYRNWSMNMFWRGAFGHDLANSFNIFYKNPNTAFGWNVTKTALELSDLREDPQFSSFYVEDASFFRLENLTIGYNFDLPSSSALRNLRLYAAGNNLWTITNYTGVDPEVRFEDFGDPLSPGIERRDQWFTQTSFVFGVDIGF
jgi:iron complex outermembrane receptor protein